MHILWPMFFEEMSFDVNCFEVRLEVGTAIAQHAMPSHAERQLGN